MTNFGVELDWVLLWRQIDLEIETLTGVRNGTPTFLTKLGVELGDAVAKGIRMDIY